MSIGKKKFLYLFKINFVKFAGKKTEKLSPLLLLLLDPGSEILDG
jgi:hypothetical protein